MTRNYKLKGVFQVVVQSHFKFVLVCHPPPPGLSRTKLVMEFRTLEMPKIFKLLQVLVRQSQPVRRSFPRLKNTWKFTHTRKWDCWLDFEVVETIVFFPSVSCFLISTLDVGKIDILSSENVKFPPSSSLGKLLRHSPDRTYIFWLLVSEFTFMWVTA